MVRYVVNAPADDEELNALFAAAWRNHQATDFGPVLEASLLYVLAYRSDALVGFIRVLQCGRTRGFVIGPTVHPDVQRQGVGTALLNEAASAAADRIFELLDIEPAVCDPEHPRLMPRHSKAILFDSVSFNYAWG